MATATENGTAAASVPATSTEQRDAASTWVGVFAEGWGRTPSTPTPSATTSNPGSRTRCE